MSTQVTNNANVNENANNNNAGVVIDETAAANVKAANPITQLLSEGAKRIKDVTVKNLNATEKDAYTMVSLTLGTQIDGFIADEDGVYSEGKTNIIFSSLYALVGAIKENDELSWLANTLINNPKAITLILSGAKVDVIQQRVPQGVAYHNPFSNKPVTDDNATYFQHDVIINYITNIRLSKVGNKMADKLADKILMASFE